jgi:hypothetical protein
MRTRTYGVWRHPTIGAVSHARFTGAYTTLCYRDIRPWGSPRRKMVCVKGEVTCRACLKEMAAIVEPVELVREVEGKR